MKIDSVKLQRKIRDRAYEKYKDKSIEEEIEDVRKRLKERGLDKLFKESGTRTSK
jgi:hypothetical protein